MASYRVTRTDKETAWGGGQHRHIAGLCLEAGRRVAKNTAISNIRTGVETYYTYERGLRANVEVVTRCEKCADAYLRTDADTTTKNNLLELPDC